MKLQDKPHNLALTRQASEVITCEEKACVLLVKSNYKLSHVQDYHCCACIVRETTIPGFSGWKASQLDAAVPLLTPTTDSLILVRRRHLESLRLVMDVDNDL